MSRSDEVSNNECGEVIAFSYESYARMLNLDSGLQLFALWGVFPKASFSKVWREALTVCG